MNAGITATEVAVNRLRTETEKTREAIRAHDKARSAESKSKSAKYSEKFHKRTKAQEVSALEEKTGSLAKQAQKNLMKKEIQEHAFRQQAAEAANGFGNVAKKFTDKAEDLMGRIAEAVVEFFEEHPGILLIVAIVLLVVLVISASLTSCSAAVGGVNDISVVTSYTAQDEEIVQADEDYITKEEELQEKISKIETDYPGYDEYRYTLDEIGHNPYELAALLTVLYEDYTAAEVQTMLQTIFDKQYKLTLTPVTETRTRTVTKTDPETGDEYEEEEEYEWKVLKVKLDNKSIDGIISEMGISDDQYARYQILLETFGNKRYLFADSEYALPRYSPIADYEVPAEYLTDVQFGNMLHEAEKYLKINNLALENRPEGLTITTHVCRGNYQSAYAASGPYDTVAPILFANENVDAFYLEYDDERSGGFEPLKYVTDGKKVVLGLITSKRPELEDKEKVIARIHEAAKYVPLENLYLSPQCGFSSNEIGNKLTEEEQWAKLELVKEIAKEVWG
mgnify:CR=1 FL=1